MSQTTIDLSGDLEAARLVELVSQRLDLSVQYNPQELTQRVTLRLREPLRDDELWDVMLATLESVGLAVVETERDGLFRVVPLQLANLQHQRLDLPGAPALPQAQSGYLATVYRLRSLDAQQATEAITPLLTPQSGISRALGQSGLLLIADVRRRVENALEVLELLDVPRDTISSFVYELANTDATSLSQLATQILGAELTVSGAASAKTADIPGAVQLIPLPGGDTLYVIAPESRRDSLESLLASLDVATPVETRSYKIAHASPTELASALQTILGDSQPGSPRRVAAESLTGAVLVTATATEHERVRVFVDSIEQAPATRRSLRAIGVRNRDAETLQATLQELLEGPSGETTSAIDGTTPGSTASARRADAPNITVDVDTNTLLVIGTAAQLEQIQTLVAQLDKRQPQVMIHVYFVSLSEGEAKDVGVELTHEFEANGTSVNLGSLFGLASAGAATASGTGFTANILNPGDFQVVVRAVETISDGMTRSSPKVLVNNNATATLQSVAQEPFTSLNASDTVATTSFGGTADAGTTVTVTPRIAEGDHLVLEYSVENSAFTGESTSTAGGGVIPPPSQQNSVDGEVTIPDGFTVVLGGIETIEEGQAQTHVPILGRLPLLGPLFRTKSTSQTRSRFYVFLHATVLRDPGFADLRLLSGADLSQLGMDDGTPVLEPVWVD